MGAVRETEARSQRSRSQRHTASALEHRKSVLTIMVTTMLRPILGHASLTLATLLRHCAWNNVTAMAAVDAEIGIGGKEDGIGERFGHAHKAAIGETHGHV
jgi:hypothetical protein